MKNRTPTLLSEFGKPDLLEHWAVLTPEEKNHLFQQLQHFDARTLQLQQKLVHQPQTQSRQIRPFKTYAYSGNQNDFLVGKKLISEGQVGCLIVAGGQGTRLGIEGPKGICSVTKVRKKSLFQLFAEKTLAASRQAKYPLSLAIMTSPLNHEDTVEYFKKNKFFGLDPQQVSFFVQETLLLLTQEGIPFFERKDSLAEGPDGNGHALHLFVKSGIWQKWENQGVNYLNFVLIDNPLADPFDAELVGYHQRLNNDVIVKCTERRDPEEHVGILVQEEGKPAVVEYSEITQEERFSLNEEGSLNHLLANLSLFCFKMDFVKKISNFQLPLHKAFKAAKFFETKKMSGNETQKKAWKFERFIFDILPLASSVDALVYPRETCFAPLKNFSGRDSLATVENDLENRDRQILRKIIGTLCEISPLEISQNFYYPTEELIDKWRGRAIVEGGYIES